MPGDGPTTQIPDVGKLTEGLPPWAVVLVVVSLAIMAVALAAPKVLPLFKDEDKKKDAPAPAPVPPVPPTPAAAAVLGSAADASNELVTKIISRLEDRLDAANSEMRQLRETYEGRIGRLQEDLGERDRLIFEMRSRLAEAERNMIAAREDASRLRWQLEQRARSAGSQPW